MTLIFELLKIIVGTQREFSVAPSQKEWKQMFLFLQQQSLLGVAMPVLKMLPKEQCPAGDLPLVWYTLADRLRLMNAELNIKSAEISRWFEEQGFKTCILKGQGNATMYPDPALRNSGDIDIWVWPKDAKFVYGDLTQRRSKILEFVNHNYGAQPCFYHHVDFPKYEHVEVEVHFTPTWMNSYFKNRELQRFVVDEAPACFENSCSIGDDLKINIPSWRLNVVFQLIHMQKHLFAEGIGLRQVMDYYYLLTTHTDAEARAKVLSVIRALGLETFLAAMQWVLHQVFGLKQEFWIGGIDESNGKLLLNEILSGGNFGKFGDHKDLGTSERLLERMTLKLRRAWQFRQLVRTEVLWSPLFKTWHYFWRKSL